MIFEELQEQVNALTASSKQVTKKKTNTVRDQVQDENGNWITLTNNTGKQERNGKAWEYALLIAIFDLLTLQKVLVQIVKDSHYEDGKIKFATLDNTEQTAYNKDAKEAMKHLLTLEPRLENLGIDQVQLRINEDQNDVRDILILVSSLGLTIGISAKHNSKSIKSGRIISNGDFMGHNFDIKSSSVFLSKVGDILDLLEADKGKYWKSAYANQADRVAKFYLPFIEALKEEFQLIQTNLNFPKALHNRFLGINDYYKINRRPLENKVLIEGYNINGLLGTTIPRCSLPKTIASIEFDNDKDGIQNTIVISFDNGLILSLRVHNGESKIIRTGLKIECEIRQYPTEIYRCEITV